MKIKIVLENQSPLSIRENHADDIIYTLDYIPGTTFLGALAASYLRRENKVDDNFKNYFLNEKVRFSPLYPAYVPIIKSSALEAKRRNEFEKEISESKHITCPIPKTATTCKRWPGFNSQVGDSQAHGVHDQLFEWTLFCHPGFNHINALIESERCGFNGCSQFMTSMENFYKIGKDYSFISERKSKKLIGMHTGIMYSVGTASPGILFSIESIQENTQFTGIIELPDEITNQFIVFLNQCDIRIGNKKTTGQGICKIVRICEEVDNDFEEFKSRILQFDAQFKEYAKKYLEINKLEKYYFSIDLFSDAILSNKFLSYNINLEPVIKLIDNANLVYQNVSAFKIMGWNNTIKLPKQAEWAIEKGSVCMAEVPELTDAVILQLYNFEQIGIGIRKNEGFGMIKISDPFHWEVRTNER